MIETQELRKMEIGSLEVAQRRLLKRLEKQGYQIQNILPINQNRYVIIKGTQNDLPKNILLMYKRDFFRSFGLEFRHLGYSGLGESINIHDLKIALQLNVTDIYTVYPWGICYSIPLMDFLNNSVRWKNKEQKEVRSISVHSLKREQDLKR